MSRKTGWLLFLIIISSGLATLLAQTPPPDQNDPRYYTRLAAAARKNKDYNAFLVNMQAALKLRPNQPVFMYNLAAAYAQLGNRAEALRWLKRVAEMGLTARIAADDDFASLKDSTEFQEILKRFESNRAPVGHSELAFTHKEKGLIAEGVAYDPVSRSFFVGSVHKRKILKIDSDGAVTEFATARDGLWAVMGMKVDDKHRVLWVASSAVPQMENLDPGDDGCSGVFSFDLRSGKKLNAYVLSNQPQKHWLGDVAITSKGQVYASDSLTPAFYVVNQQSNQLDMFFDHGPFVSPQGMAFSPDERTMFASDYAKGIFAIDMHSRECAQLPAPENAAIVGVDGMYIYRGNLIGIQNGTNPHRVVRITLTPQFDRITGVEVLEANNPLFDEPTLGVILEGGTLYYIADSQWGKIDDSGKLAADDLLRDLVVLKLKL